MNEITHITKLRKEFETLKTNWVIGLGWSHAMFIIVLNELKDLLELKKY